MKKFGLWLPFLFWILSGCSAQQIPPVPAGPPLGMPSEQASPIANSTQQTPGEKAVVTQLAANLALPVTEIKVLSISPIVWSDSCLGVPLEGLMCAQVVSPGYRFVLAADAFNYEYHANQDASRILPATLALQYRREGGIAGFCEHLTVYASGELAGLNCVTNSSRKIGSLVNLLSNEERQQFYTLLRQYGMVSIDLSDPANASDGMTRKVDFFGFGTGQPREAAQQGIYQWAESLYQKLYQ